MAVERRLNKWALLIGIMVCVTAVVAAGVSWWRWERVLTVAGDVPLPPATELLEARLVEGKEDKCVYRCTNPREAGKVRDFFVRELEAGGWILEPDDGSEILFSKQEKTVRIVIRLQARRTYYTVFVRPCSRLF